MLRYRNRLNMFIMVVWLVVLIFLSAAVLAVPPVSGNKEAAQQVQHSHNSKGIHTRHPLATASSNKHSSGASKPRTGSSSFTRSHPVASHPSRPKEHFVLFSTPDEAFYKTSYRYQDTVRAYAERHGYSYYLHPSNFTYYQYEVRGSLVGPHYYRMFAALQLLSGKVSLPPGKPKADWIVYLDADVLIAEPYLPLEAILDAAAAFRLRLLHDEEDCHFVAQDYQHIVNSGFFLLRNNAWSLDFIKQWIAECERAAKYPLRWVYDQGPLQNTILKDIAYHVGASYDDECWRSRSDNLANLCWEFKLKSWGLPYGKRVRNNICLLPSNEGMPLAHHVHQNHQRGQLLYHGKGLNQSEIEVLATQDYVVTHYDRDLKQLQLHNDTLFYIKVPKSISTAVITSSTSNAGNSTNAAKTTSGNQFYFYVYRDGKKLLLHHRDHLPLMAYLPRLLTYFHVPKNLSTMIVHIQTELAELIPGEEVLHIDDLLTHSPQ